MTATAAPASSRLVELPGGLTLTITEQGDPGSGASTGILLLHGGAGARSMAGLSAGLSQHAFVVTPTHPGFDGTPRPDGFDSVADLAVAYLDLLDALNLTGAIVIGSSMGGWIAAEMALRDTRKVIAAVILINSAGIKGDPGQEITDVSAISPAELARLAFYKPEFRPDPSAFTAEQREAAAANQGTLAVYAGDHMYDPKLRGRLHRVEVPVLVIWGEGDGVIPLAYGRTFAGSFSSGRLVAVPDAGHLPFIENPAAVFAAISEFVATEVRPDEDSA